MKLSPFCYENGNKTEDRFWIHSEVGDVDEESFGANKEIGSIRDI